MTKDEFKDKHNVWDKFSTDEEVIQSHMEFNEDIDALIADEIQRHEEGKWIAYPDYPPPNNGTQIIIMAKNTKDEYDTICIDARHIIHYMAIAWQPLPEPYKP